MAALSRRPAFVFALASMLLACGAVLSSSATGPDEEAGDKDASAEAGDRAEAGEADGPPVAPNPSYAYPTANTDAGLVAAGAFKLTIQSERAATILFTLDGTEPTDASASSASPLKIPLDASTVVRYRTDDDPTVRTLPVTVDPALRRNQSIFITEVAFDLGGGPIVVAKPNEVLTGKLFVRRWACDTWCSVDGGPAVLGDTSEARICCGGTTGFCPSCVRFYAYGVERTEGCLGGGLVDQFVYPGASGTVSFSVRAPAAPGTYRLRHAAQEEFSCQLDAGGLGGDDALIIVR